MRVPKSPKINFPRYGFKSTVDDATKNKPYYGLQSVVDDAETERRLLTGREAWNEGREQNGGEVPAEPEQQRMASSE